MERAAERQRLRDKIRYNEARLAKRTELNEYHLSFAKKVDQDEEDAHDHEPRPELRRPSRRPKFRLTKKDGTSALNPDLKNTGVPHPNFEWLEENQTRLTQTGTAYPDRNSLPR